MNITTKKNIKISKNDFVVKSDILSTFNFLNLSVNDIESKDKDISIKKVKVETWNLFDKVISVKLDLDVGGLSTTYFIALELKIDALKVISQIIKFNPEKSFIHLNENLKFVPLSVETTAPDSSKYFSEKEIVELNKILKEIQIFNIKIKNSQDSLDIFNKNTIGSFDVSVKMRERIFDNVLFFAQYDASSIQKTIEKSFVEFSTVEKIEGIVRRVVLKDIYPYWDEININQKLNELGFENILESQVEVITTNLDFENSKALVQIRLKNDPSKKVIFEKIFYFTESLLKIFNDSSNEDKTTLKVTNKELLEGSPKLNILSSTDFVTNQDNFSISSVEPHAWDAKRDNFKNARTYKFLINPKGEEGFIHNQEFKFKTNHVEASFKSVESHNLISDVFVTKDPVYFQTLMSQALLSNQWIDFDETVFDKIKLSQEFDEFDFKIDAVQFKRLKLTSESKVSYKIILKSKILNSEREFFGEFDIDTNSIQEVLQEVDPDKIEIKNRTALYTEPNKIITIDDFIIEEPYKLVEGVFKRDKTKSLIECDFKVQFLEEKKKIHKEIYYGDLIPEIANNDNVAKEVSEIKEEDLQIIFDPNQNDYIKNPSVKITYDANPSIYINIKDILIKNSKGKAYVLVSLKHGIESSDLKIKLQFNNPISKEEFDEYKREQENNF